MLIGLFKSWKLNVGGDRIYAFLNAGGVILVPSFSLIAKMPPVNYVVNSRSIYYNVSLASALSKIKDMAVLDDIIRLWSFDFLMLTAKWYYQSRDNSYRKI